MTTANQIRPAGAVLRVRIVFAPGVMLGPGKADLLALIRETGSIAATGDISKGTYRWETA